jgi:hypothetical protein
VLHPPKSTHTLIAAPWEPQVSYINTYNVPVTYKLTSYLKSYSPDISTPADDKAISHYRRIIFLFLPWILYFLHSRFISFATCQVLYLTLQTGAINNDFLYLLALDYYWDKAGEHATNRYTHGRAVFVRNTAYTHTVTADRCTRPATVCAPLNTTYAIVIYDTGCAQLVHVLHRPFLLLIWNAVRPLLWRIDYITAEKVTR